MQAIKNNQSNLTHEQISSWFDDTISHLQGDKFIMQNDLASSETSTLYANLITGNIDTLLMDFRKKSGVFFAKNLVVDFVDFLINSSQIPNNLAFSVSDSKVFIWSEINENDEKTEDALIEAEGKVNAKYYSIGYNVSTTIVEDCDKLKIPSHYIIIPIKDLRENWQISQNT